MSDVATLFKSLPSWDKIQTILWDRRNALIAEMIYKRDADLLLINRLAGQVAMLDELLNLPIAYEAVVIREKQREANAV